MAQLLYIDQTTRGREILYPPKLNYIDVNSTDLFFLRFLFPDAGRIMG
jgi:hypothetical protein